MSEGPGQNPEQFHFTTSVVTRENSHFLAKIRRAVDGIEDQAKLNREVTKYSEGVVSPRIAFLAMNGEEVVGYIEINTSEELPDGAPQVDGISNFAHLSRVGTLNEYRRKGIAKNLIKLAEDWARDNDKDGMWLDYLEEKAELHILYSGADYVERVRFEDKDKGKTRIIAAKAWR